MKEMVHGIRRKTMKWLRVVRAVVGGTCIFLCGIVLLPESTLAQGVDARHHAAGGASSRAARGTPNKLFRYARRVIEEYDENRNGQLEQDEWSRMAGEPQRVDVDSDGIVTVDEYVAYVSDYGRHHNIRLVVSRLNPPASHGGHVTTLETEHAASQSPLSPGSQSPETRSASQSKNRQKGIFYVPSSRLPGGLPSWFRSRDINGDGQVTVAEFSHSLDPTELREFSRYDSNRDGVLAPDECVHGTGKSSQKIKSSTSRSAKPSASSARSSFRPTATAATRPNRPVPPSKYRSTKPTAASIDRSNNRSNRYSSNRSGQPAKLGSHSFSQSPASLRNRPNRSNVYGTSSLDRPKKTSGNKSTTSPQSAARKTMAEHPSTADRLRPVPRSNGSKSGSVSRSSLNKSDKLSKSAAMKAEKESRSAEARRNQKEDHSKKRKKSSADKSQKSSSDKHKSR